MAYFKELSMYILAGKKKLAEVRANELQQAMDKAKQSGLPEDAQAARDLADQCARFEKKLYDLELTRNISRQMGPQIRLLQNNNTMMAEKIQSTICLLYTSCPAAAASRSAWHPHRPHRYGRALPSPPPGAGRSFWPRQRYANRKIKHRL